MRKDVFYLMNQQRAKQRNQEQWLKVSRFMLDAVGLIGIISIPLLFLFL